MDVDNVLELNEKQTKAILSLQRFINYEPKTASGFGLKTHLELEPIMLEDDYESTNDNETSKVNNKAISLCETKKPSEKDRLDQYMDIVNGINFSNDGDDITNDFSTLPREKNQKYNYLLLGPGGSGKTTVIVNAFDNSPLKIAFCAFTNKATQVLSNIANKFDINFSATFMTIHKFYMLEPRYLDKETEVSFKFDRTKLEHLKNYDVIIFDECSTISKELYSYIQQAWEIIYFKHDKCLKHIFLGDYWQLPPVGEEKSIIFNDAINHKWKVSKLYSVMRSKNKLISGINSRLLRWIDKFKTSKQLEKFHIKYPYNLVKYDTNIYINGLHNFYYSYIREWTINPDVVILTYSKANCNKTNYAIQDIIDTKAGRTAPENRDILKFYVGDRCCIDKPIEVCKIDRRVKNKVHYVMLKENTNEMLYNGEIFDILQTEDVLIKTSLNTLSYVESYFHGQLLTISRIDTNTTINKVDEKIHKIYTTYEILHIYDHQINKARYQIKYREKKHMYISLFTTFMKHYPVLNYGYCITVYKSQGSEWNTVFVNLNSIKWCIASNTKATLNQKKQLFKTTYTAISRASSVLKLYWSNM